MGQADEQSEVAIAALKRDVSRLEQPALTRLVHQMYFIDLADVDRLSPGDEKAMMQFLKNWPYRGYPFWPPDDKRAAIRLFAKNQTGNNPPGRNLILYNSSTLRGADMDPEVVLAHEFGHRAIDLGWVALTGKNKEAAADNFAAQVTTPQRVVDMLRNMAKAFPDSNEIPGKADRRTHPTAYERALAIVHSFPGKAAMGSFPSTSSPAMTVEGHFDPVPMIVPVPVPSPSGLLVAPISVPEKTKEDPTNGNPLFKKYGPYIPRENEKPASPPRASLRTLHSEAAPVDVELRSSAPSKATPPATAPKAGTRPHL